MVFPWHRSHRGSNSLCIKHKESKIEEKCFGQYGVAASFGKKRKKKTGKTGDHHCSNHPFIQNLESVFPCASKKVKAET